MIGTAEELKLNVKGYRLLKLNELRKFGEFIPEINCCIKWWLDDIDPENMFAAAYAEGNYEGDDVYCDRDRLNLFIRPALDIEGVAAAGLSRGDEFIYKGFLFTIIEENVAIANNVMGSAKYYDVELANFWWLDEDEGVTDTILGILEASFG